MRERTLGVQRLGLNLCDMMSLQRRSYKTSTSQVNRRASDAMRTGMCGTSDNSTVWYWLAISR